MRLRILPRAVRDLAEIEMHLRKQQEPGLARVVSERLRRSLELIARKPDIGRPGPRPPVREWSVPGLPYVIPYRVTEDSVDILRVYHTRRKRPSAW